MVERKGNGPSENPAGFLREADPAFLQVPFPGALGAHASQSWVQKMGFEVKSQSSAGTGEEFILQAEGKEEPGLSPGEKRERLDKAGSCMKGFADTRLQVWLFSPPFPNAQMPSTDRFSGPLRQPTATAATRSLKPTTDSQNRRKS